jgi:hypothetical protein
MPSFPAGSPGSGIASKRKRAHLSHILDRHLAAYALAAGAAGVGVTASALAPKENSIVYTPANIPFVGHARENYPPVKIDLNGDGITDVTISAAGSGYSLGSEGISYYQGAAGWGAAAGAGGVEAPLAQGREIGPARNFVDGGPLLDSQHRYRHHKSWNRCRGPFQAPYRSPLTAYLGLKFQISGETHYGWVSLTTECGDGTGYVTGTVDGYAYNTVADMPIRAGQTSDVTTDSKSPDSETSDSVTSKTDAAPATLGALSLGSQGLTLWRRNSK